MSTTPTPEDADAEVAALRARLAAQMRWLAEQQELLAAQAELSAQMRQLTEQLGALEAQIDTCDDPEILAGMFKAGRAAYTTADVLALPGPLAGPARKTGGRSRRR